MPDLTLESHAQRQLRVDAETRLRDGVAPANKSWPASPDSLALLYKLASSPATASDALKLLHELQVHQVEIDLLDAQYAATERERADELTHYKALFDHAPVGYLKVDLERGRIIDSNPRAASLLGAPHAQLADRDLGEYLSPAGASALAAVLQTLRAGSARASCRAQTRLSEDAHSLQVNASLAPDGETAMVALSIIDPA